MSPRAARTHRNHDPYHGAEGRSPYLAPTLLGGLAVAYGAPGRAALDITWRIEELLYLFDQADGVLARALDAPLTRADLGLPTRGETVSVEDDDDAPG